MIGAHLPTSVAGGQRAKAACQRVFETLPGIV